LPSPSTSSSKLKPPSLLPLLPSTPTRSKRRKASTRDAGAEETAFKTGNCFPKQLEMPMNANIKSVESAVAAAAAEIVKSRRRPALKAVEKAAPKSDALLIPAAQIAAVEARLFLEDVKGGKESQALTFPQIVLRLQAAQPEVIEAAKKSDLIAASKGFVAVQVGQIAEAVYAAAGLADQAAYVGDGGWGQDRAKAVNRVRQYGSWIGAALESGVALWDADGVVKSYAQIRGAVEALRAEAGKVKAEKAKAQSEKEAAYGPWVRLLRELAAAEQQARRLLDDEEEDENDALDVARQAVARIAGLLEAIEKAGEAEDADEADEG